MINMNFENIPGMIEPIEQELLYRVSKNLDLSEKKTIVESENRKW